MAQPPPYDRTHNFNGLSVPTDIAAGTWVNAELDAISGVTDAIRANLALIQRDDGELANDSVHPESLSPETVALIQQSAGVVDGLRASNNLSELTSTALARENLGLALLAASGNADDLMWTPAGRPQRGVADRLADTIHAQDFGATANSGTDCTAQIQAAIDFAAAQGGGLVWFGYGTYVAKRIKLKTGVYLRGLGIGATRLLLTAGSTAGDLVTIDNFYAIQAARPSTGAFPVDFGLGDMTLDGNALNNTGNSQARGLAFYGLGFRIIGPLAIVNCWRHGAWMDGGPSGNQGDDYCGMFSGGPLYILNCNQSREPDVAGGVGGGAFYFNGVADSRISPLFVGMTQGGYGLKNGPEGTCDWVHCEIWGGAWGRQPDWPVGTGITRSGTTATLTFAQPHPFRVGELVHVYSGAVANLNGQHKVVSVPNSTQITYTVDAATGANFTGEVLAVPYRFPQRAWISEAAGCSMWGNLSGGYVTQALWRASNNEFHSLRENYLLAGDGSRTEMVQGGVQFGDSANGFMNVVNCTWIAKHGDMLGPQVIWDSSGGYNRVEIHGFTNYAGKPVSMTGTPHADDEFLVRLAGMSPYEDSRLKPVNYGAVADGKALGFIGRSGDSYAGIRLLAADRVTNLAELGIDPNGLQLYLAGVQRYAMNTVGLYPGDDNARELGNVGKAWKGLWLKPPNDYGGITHLLAHRSDNDQTVRLAVPGPYANDAAAATGGVAVGGVYYSSGTGALRTRMT